MILAVDMTISEVPNGPSRVFFSTSSKDINTAVHPFRFDTTDSDSCVEVLAYSKVCITTCVDVLIKRVCLQVMACEILFQCVT